MKKILASFSIIMVLVISVSFNSIKTDSNKNEVEQLTNKIADQNVIQLKPKISIKNVFRLMNTIEYHEVIEYLLTQGLDVNARYSSPDESRLNLLMIACQMNDIKLAEMLIDQGAFLDEKNSEGKTALLLSMSHKDGELVKLLIKKGAQFNERDHRGNLAFFFAVIRDNFKAVEILIENGLKIEQEIRTFIYPMATQNIAMIELLINNGFNLNLIDKAGFLPFHYALLLMCDEGKEILLDFKLISNTQIAFENLEKNILKVIELFVINGAKLDQDNMISPIFSKILLNNKRLMDLFFRYGGNPNVRVKLKNIFSLLSLAVIERNIEVIKLLLNKGADVNESFSYNITALFFASNKEIAELIIEKCSDIDHKDARGDTALNWAIIMKNEELIDFLISKGANITLKNFKGLSVLDLAKIYGNQNIIDLLIKKGAC